MLTDNKFRKPRKWSNNELKKFSKNFYGDVINISGWKDSDKQNSFYKNYFYNCKNYFISNWSFSERGQESNLLEHEYLIDLEKTLEEKFIRKFEVVFNHTTLEHVFDIYKAFQNLCAMSNDTVIIVLPFLQEQHTNSDFEDYWRVSPQAIKKMFERNNFNLAYINSNDDNNSSIYIFAVGCSKNSKNFDWIKNINENKLENLDKYLIGKKIIKNNFITKLYNKILG